MSKPSTSYRLSDEAREALKTIAARRAVSKTAALDSIIKEASEPLWLKYYVNWDVSLCSLCANSGIIDTRGIKSAAGVQAGRLNYCLCPNGQEYRRVDIHHLNENNGRPKKASNK